MKYFLSTLIFCFIISVSKGQVMDTVEVRTDNLHSTIPDTAISVFSDRFYLYGLKQVHNEYLRVGTDKNFYLKPEAASKEILIKRFKPDEIGKYYLIIPGMGNCLVTLESTGFNVVNGKGLQTFYQQLQGCDKPGEDYPIECK